MLRLFKKKMQNNQGQSLVEFALVVPILFTLIFGIMDFGQLLYHLQVVNTAAREGARRAITQGDLAQVTSVVKRFDPSLNVTMIYDPVLPSPTAIPATGTLVTVQVTKSVEFLTPLNVLFPSNPYPVAGRCIMTF